MRQIINFIEEKSGGEEQELRWNKFLHGSAQNGESSDSAVKTAVLKLLENKPSLGFSAVCQ